jgi:PknH-like extracellular domain
MSFRAKIVASLALATSAFLLVPAAAQAATHPVQVTGAKLKTALLPASTFGSGFKLLGTTDSGKSLWHQKATKHIPTMSCQNFEDLGLASYGESAVATSVILDNSTPTTTDLSNLNILYEQMVYQFPSTKAAATFYNQAHAKYASCKSFTDKVSGDPNSDATITLKSIATTKVGTHRAFQLTQGISESGPASISLKLNTLVTVKGADIFIFVNAGTANHPVPAKTMLELVSRVAGLR